MLLHYLSFEMVPARRSSVRIAIDRESPIAGDGRFSSPGVPPKRTAPPEDNAYPRPFPRGSIRWCSRAKVRRCASARSASLGPGEKTDGPGSARFGTRGTPCEMGPRRARRPSAYLGNLRRSLATRRSVGARVCAAAHKPQHVVRRTTLHQAVITLGPSPGPVLCRILHPNVGELAFSDVECIRPRRRAGAASGYALRELLRPA
jgi:hypothetical protein